MGKRTEIEIKSRFGTVLFKHKTENNTIKKTIKEAVKNSADLHYADLSYADLSSTNLRYANLSYADLISTNLRSANLSYADLRFANLSYTMLHSADLSYADLSSANLSYANLSYANLRYADLRYANLRSAKNLHTLSQTNLNILKFQKGKIRAFKYLDGLKSPYQGYEYKIGKTYKVSKYNSDETVLCGEGLNVATLAWCLKDAGCDLDKTYIEVEHDVKDIVAIPYNSDGKWRVKKLKVIKKLTKKYLMKYMERGW